MPTDLTPVSDYCKIAHITLQNIPETKTEFDGKRFWAYYESARVLPILRGFDDGTAKVVARDFAVAIQLVKNRIFEAHRIYLMDAVVFSPVLRSL